MIQKAILTLWFRWKNWRWERSLNGQRVCWKCFCDHNSWVKTDDDFNLRKLLYRIHLEPLSSAEKLPPCPLCGKPVGELPGAMRTDSYS